MELVGQQKSVKTYSMWIYIHSTQHKTTCVLHSSHICVISDGRALFTNRWSEDWIGWTEDKMTNQWLGFINGIFFKYKTNHWLPMTNEMTNQDNQDSQKWSWHFFRFQRGVNGGTMSYLKSSKSWPCQYSYGRTKAQRYAVIFMDELTPITRVIYLYNPINITVSWAMTVFFNPWWQKRLLHHLGPDSLPIWPPWGWQQLTLRRAGGMVLCTVLEALKGLIGILSWSIKTMSGILHREKFSVHTPIGI